MEHARLLRRFRQTLLRLGCDHFEVYEQVGTNWNTGETTGRFVQIMRFRDRKHQLAVQAAERSDTTAQTLVREFCELINFPYQQQQGLFAVGFYTSFLRMPPQRTTTATVVDGSEPEPMGEGDAEGADVLPLQPEDHPDSHDPGGEIPEANFGRIAPAEEDANGGTEDGGMTDPVEPELTADENSLTEDDPSIHPK
jgi:hypothetical protein